MKILIIGHSHINALREGISQGAVQDCHELGWIQLRTYTRSGERAGSSQASKVDMDRLRAEISGFAADACIICTNGNDHFSLGLCRGDSTAATRAAKRAQVISSTRSKVSDWLKCLKPLLPKRQAFLSAPPPFASDELSECVSGPLADRYEGIEFESAEYRMDLWRAYQATLESLCTDHGLALLALPSSVTDQEGRLLQKYWSKNFGHGNAEYGAEVLEAALAWAAAPQVKADASLPRAKPRAPHPYKSLPDSSFWRQAVSDRSAEDMDPVVNVKFQIGGNDKVATAGSCFAQHISKRLRAGGFQYMLVEQPEAGAAMNQAETRGFYDFTARYGNIYTARQLLQLFDRAYGYYTPCDDHWQEADGRFLDPFRPRIEPEGFESLAALRADRAQHLSAVRTMFESLDIFVFTLGLTECWLSTLDGAAYPVAPGTAGGVYDPARHHFHNFNVDEIMNDMSTFLNKLALVNPSARMILTVSPVPLVATAAPQHVLVSTVYSKSVLRVAAEEIQGRYAGVQYFPSYEIITGPHSGGRYFGADKRSVTEYGVAQVMKVFMARMTVGSKLSVLERPAEADALLSQQVHEMEALAEAECDEEVLRRT